MSQPGFYVDESITPLTSSFVPFPLGLNAGFLALFNDDTSGSNLLEWSFDGTNLHGALKPGQHIEVANARIGSIQLRYAVGAPAYKVIAIAA